MPLPSDPARAAAGSTTAVYLTSPPAERSFTRPARGEDTEPCRAEVAHCLESAFLPGRLRGSPGWGQPLPAVLSESPAADPTDSVTSGAGGDYGAPDRDRNRDQNRERDRQG